MARSEWLRTFVAIYRTGSVTDGAAVRQVSQPAASQQLANLERAVGTSLFVRTPHGVEPTRAGGDLYTQVGEALDRIEGVLGDLDTGHIQLPRHRIVVGARPEVFEHVVLPRLAAAKAVGTAVFDAKFGEDADLIESLVRGDIDIAITNLTPARRVATSTPIGIRTFALVAAPRLAPPARFRSLERLGDWLDDQPWVSYSDELPLTRRFWQTHLGRPFGARLRLVAADLRVVAAAVEAGMGISLLPEYVCRAALDAGHLYEVHPIRDLVASDPWYASVRPTDATRLDIAETIATLSP